MATAPLHDMHVHLAFVDGAEDVAAAAGSHSATLFSNTVTPSEYLRHRDDAATWDAPTLHIGVGLHPWWVDPQGYAADLALFEQIVASWKRGPLLIGEVGLDFSPRHESTREAQLTAFTRICKLADARARQDAAGTCDRPEARSATGASPRRGRPAAPVLSIHAVRSASTVLDVLEAAGCLDRTDDGSTRCSCILHWFSGTSDELHRAVKAGCYFSVGPRMVDSKRGREYARQIPLSQLLLETDDPEGEGVVWPYDRIRAGLEAAFDQIALSRGAASPESRLALAEAIDRNTRRLLLGE